MDGSPDIYIAKHSAQILAPTTLGIMMQGIEIGILINQFSRFWSRSGRQHLLIQGTVTFLFVAACVQTALSFYSAWLITVSHYGNLAALSQDYWLIRLQPLLNGILAAPVQAFYTLRCWNALKRRRIVLLPLALMNLAAVLANIIITTRMFKVSKVESSLQHQICYNFVPAFTLSAGLDILITGIALWLQLGVNGEARSLRSEKIVHRLMSAIWASALPQCACAIAACLVCITMACENLWDLFLQVILGKMYIISLLAVLNGQESAKPLPTFMSDFIAARTGSQWCHTISNGSTQFHPSREDFQCFDLSHSHSVAARSWEEKVQGSFSRPEEAIDRPI